MQQLIKAGGTAESIAATLEAEGVRGVSRATVGRRIRELAGPRRMGRLTSGPAPGRRVAGAAAPDAPSAAKATAEPAAPDAAPAPAHPTGTPPAPPALAASASDPALASVSSDDEEDMPLPEGELPEGLSLAALHRVLRKADRAAATALARQDFVTFGAMGRLITSAGEAIRKSTPPSRVDPAESPDMIAAANRARETFHKLIERTVGGANDG